MESRESILEHFRESLHNPEPQTAPGLSAAIGHVVENSIPLSVFPIAADKTCVVFCGPLGGGKTHLARRLARYLTFFHAIPCEIFCVGEYRRHMFGAFGGSLSTTIRLQSSEQALHDMVGFFQNHDFGVAIFDASNPTHEHRSTILNEMHSVGAKVMFVEVLNESEQFFQEQIKLASGESPDYEGMSQSEAEINYRNRVLQSQSLYDPIDRDRDRESGPGPLGPLAPLVERWSYLKCDYSRERFVIHNLKGNWQLKVVHFITNVHANRKSFYLTRHGQSQYNAVGRIGGDSGLTQDGLNYAKALATFVEEKIVRNESGEVVPSRLWTSTMLRTKETAQFIRHDKIITREEFDPSTEVEWVQMKPRAWHHLDEIFAGQCDGMTYEEIEEVYPEEAERRAHDKLAYRYPRGESYLDLIARLEPMIIEMERHREPLLIIGHQAVLRLIYAFYKGLSRNEAPFVSVPLNCVLELTPGAYSCTDKKHILYRPLVRLAADGQDEKKMDSMSVSTIPTTLTTTTTVEVEFEDDPQSH